MNLSISGPVAPNSAEHVARGLEDQVLQCLDRMEYVNIRGGRQTGKTTTILSIRKRLDKAGLRTGYVDATLCQQHQSVADWLTSFFPLLAASFVPKGRQDFPAPSDFGGIAAWLAHVVRSDGLPLVIFIDEVTAIPAALQHGFFTHLRALFNQRNDLTSPSEVRKVTFVFAGTFDPERLIQGANSPFNIASDFLSSDYDFTESDVHRLSELGGAKDGGEGIFLITRGHPYLTNRCINLVSSGNSLDVAVETILRSDVHFRNLGAAIRSLEPEVGDLLAAIVEGTSLSCTSGLDEVLDALSARGVLRCGTSNLLEVRCPLYERFVREYLSRRKSAGESLLLAGAAPEPKTTAALKEPAKADVVILCALKVELDRVLAHLGTAASVTVGGNEYYKASVKGLRGQEYRVVVHCMYGMGNVNAALATKSAIDDWDPLHFMLVGIAAGRKGLEKAKLGDVLIGEQIISYETASRNLGGDESRYQAFRPAHDLFMAAKRLPAASWCSNIQVQRPDGEPSNILPTPHFGVIATGEKIVKNEAFAAELSSDWSKLIGLEMEGYGASMALYKDGRAPGVFLVKGISDWADEHKNDAWQPYAADAAAAFAIAVLEAEAFLSRSAS